MAFPKKRLAVRPSPDWYEPIEIAYIDAIRRKSEIEAEIQELRSQLIEEMRERKRVHIETPNSSVSLVKGYEGRRINTDALKKDYPDIYEEYSEPYMKDDYITVSIKK